MVSAIASPPTDTETEIINRAVELLRLVDLNGGQITIEHAIGLVSIKQNCSRIRAAQILHHKAWQN